MKWESELAAGILEKKKIQIGSINFGGVYSFQETYSYFEMKCLGKVIVSNYYPRENYGEVDSEET